MVVDRAVVATACEGARATAHDTIAIGGRCSVLYGAEWLSVAIVMRERATAMTGAIVWSGTFHAVGARLLREYAEAIGLDRAFTIHDREDSADLMNLVRHDLGFSKTKKRFPLKGTCFAIYSRTVNTEVALEEVLASFFPWCVVW